MQLPPPQNVTAVPTSGVNPGVKVSWSTVDGADGYEVDRLISGDTGWTTVLCQSSRVPNTGSTTSFTDHESGGVPNQAPSTGQYYGLRYYRVRATSVIQGDGENCPPVPVFVSTPFPSFMSTPRPTKLGYATSDQGLMEFDKNTLVVTRFLSIPHLGPITNAGRLLFVADYFATTPGSNGNLYVIDKSSFTVIGHLVSPNLLECTSLTPYGPTRLVAVSQVGSNVFGTINIVDVSNPAAPTIIESVGGFNMGAPIGAVIQDDQLMVCGNGIQAVIAIDLLANPPAILWEVNIFGVGEGPFNVIADNNYLFVTHDCGVLVIYDIGNLADPRIVGAVGDFSTTKNFALAPLAKMNNYVFLATGNTATPVVTTVDVSDPTNPAVIGKMGFNATNVSSVALANGRLFVLAAGSITSFDTSNPRLLFQTAQLNDSRLTLPQFVSVQEA